MITITHPKQTQNKSWKISQLRDLRPQNKNLLKETGEKLIKERENATG